MSWTPPPTPGPPTWVGPYGPPSPSAWGPPPAAWGPPPAGLGYTGPGYEQPGPPRPPGSNGMAIASLIFGIIGWVLLSVPFGIAALGRIRRTGQDGRGLAIAGLVLSAFWTVVFVVLAVIIAAQPNSTTGSGAQSPTATSTPRSTTTPSTGSGSVPVNSLQVGDCVNGLRDSEHLQSLPSVPCAQPHEGEVFAVFDLPPGNYPGRLSPAITVQCSSRFAAYAPNADVRNIGLYVVYPRPESWARGNREVDCIATASGGTTTGSLRSGGDGGGGLST